MGDCKKVVEEYKKEFWEKKDNPEFVKELIEDALEIMKICDIGTNEARGYIIVLGTGGPHVEINTRDNMIYCYWWGDGAHAELPTELRDAIEDYLDGLY